MSSNSDARKVFDFLSSLNLHFSVSWVLGYVNHYKSLNANLNYDELCDTLYKKWLVTDLRDAKVPALPANLASHAKITLTGTYAVQVESMVNSAQSSYSELQRIQRSTKSTEITEKAVEETSKRCLTFLLCDGVQEVQAMEYQPIPSVCLSDSDFPAGFKILLKGPIICRKGMLLLTEKNIKVLGGKVNNLCERNNMESLLRRRLGLSAIEKENESERSQTVDALVNSQELDSVIPEISEVDMSNHSLQTEVNLHRTTEMDEMSLNNDIFMSTSYENIDDDEWDHNVFENCVDTELNFLSNLDVPNITTNNKLLSHGNANLISSMSVEKSSREEDALSSMSNTSTQLKETCVNSSDLFIDHSVNDKNISLTSQHYFNDHIIEDYGVQSTSNYSEGGSKEPSGHITEKKNCQMKMSTYLVGVQKEDSGSIFTGCFSDGVKKNSPKIVNSYPFVYLKQLVDIFFSKPTTFTVKGIILTLKSKLSIKNDEFALKANISDGSFTVQVNFCSQVLENILEFSPSEITAMMNEKRKNSAVYDKVKEIFFSAQQKLLSMNCLMEIKFFPDKSTPVVVGLEDIQLKHLNALRGRAC